jgi:CheY-like chemotaxis protein
VTSISPRSGRVLVIDDSDLAREAMGDELRKGGFTVFALPSPIGSTQHVLQNAIDVVVIDIQMPSISGDKLAKLFRSSTRFTGVRIVLVTGERIDDVDRMLAEVQADAFVAKRDIPTLLVPTVSRLVAERTAHRA